MGGANLAVHDACEVRCGDEWHGGSTSRRPSRSARKRATSTVRTQLDWRPCRVEKKSIAGSSVAKAVRAMLSERPTCEKKCSARVV